MTSRNRIVIQTWPNLKSPARVVTGCFSATKNMAAENQMPALQGFDSSFTHALHARGLSELAARNLARHQEQISGVRRYFASGGRDGSGLGVDCLSNARSLAGSPAHWRLVSGLTFSFLSHQSARLVQ
jgi:hypothetical protein